MSGLPPGWEADYDGARWFYRYKATGLTQFNFPKVGDEFPEYLSTGSEAFNLAPEERLASERQVKRRGTSDDGQHEAKLTDSPRKRQPLGGIDEMSATGYFDPASFLYLGPESYSDVSPTVDEDGATDEKGEKIGQTESSVSSVTATPDPRPSSIVVVAESSSKTTPLNSHLTGESIVSTGSEGAANTPAETSEIHMLDGQPVPAELSGVTSRNTEWTPVGYMAELASSDTTRCADELAPIELDASTSATGFFGTHVNPAGPVELPTEKSPRRPQSPDSQRASAPLQVVDTYPLVSASFSFPPLRGSRTSPPAQKSQVKGQSTHLVNSGEKSGATDNQQTTYQPWNPANSVANDGRASKRSSMILSNVSVLQSQDSELGAAEPKGKSASGQGPASAAVQRHPAVLTPPSGPKVPVGLQTVTLPDRPPRSPIPAVLKPANLVSGAQTGPSQVSQAAQILIPGSSARHDSITSNTTGPALTHIPSVLKPGTYPRNNVVQSEHEQQAESYPQSLQPRQETTTSSQNLPRHQLESAAIDHGCNSDANGNHLRPITHRIRTAPNQLPSQEIPRLILSGPGLFVFQEIPSIRGTSADQTRLQGKHEHLDAEHKGIDQTASFLQDGLVVAPLAVSRTPPTRASGPVLKDGALVESVLEARVSNDKPDATSESQSNPPGTAHGQAPDLPRPQKGSTNEGESTIMELLLQLELTRKANQSSTSNEIYQNTSVRDSSQRMATQPMEPKQSSGERSEPPGKSQQSDDTIQVSQPCSQINQVDHPLSNGVSPSKQKGSLPGDTARLAQPLQIVQDLDTSSQSLSGKPSLPRKPVKRHTTSPPSFPSTSPSANIVSTQGNQAYSSSLSQLQQLCGTAPLIAHSPPVTQTPLSAASSLVSTSTQSSLSPQQMPSSTFSQVHENTPVYNNVTQTTATPTSQIVVDQTASSSQISTPPATTAHYVYQHSATSSPQNISSNKPATHIAPVFTYQSQNVSNHFNITPSASTQSTPAPNGGSPQTQLHSIMQNSVQAPNNQMGTSHHPAVWTQGISKPPAGNTGQTTSSPPLLALHQHHHQPPQSQTQQPASQQAYPQTTQQHPKLQYQTLQSSQSAQTPTAQVHSTQSTHTQSQYLYQNPTLTTADTAAALKNAGKELKGWAKRVFKSPAVQQTTAVVGGAIASEALGGNAMAGAMLANRIYQNSQSQQAGRPPGPTHTQTAPPQAQGLPGPRPPVHVSTQPVPGMQTVGVQTPGRPFAVQNPAMAGVPVQAVQQPGPRPPQPQPAVGRPSTVKPQWHQGVHANPVMQVQANNQQVLNQNIAISGSASGTTAPGVPAMITQPPMQNTVVIDNSTADSYFAPQQPANVEVVNVNIDTTNTTNMQMATAPMPTYVDSTTFMGDATYVDATTYVDTTNVNVDSTTVVDVNVEVDQNYYMSAGDTVPMYTVDEATTTENISEWSAATVDYSGGDWGDAW
ncbi:hypothetical protein SUNI508_06992 [Seiridium unicorne]|uniref:WW domain-containing protein n=1 Tax=Seiridium unicorne TaxID=138068 RepID=A0ABR2UZB0_9PEZI